MLQIKEQNKTPEQLNEIKIGNLPKKKKKKKRIQNNDSKDDPKISEKEWRQRLRRLKKMFNKDLEELKNKQSEMNNTINEMKLLKLV